jgi:TolA-binding protein
MYLVISNVHKRICEAGGCGLISASLALVVSVSLVGCATAQQKPKSVVDSGTRVRRLKSQLKKQKSLIQDLKERNLVLEKRKQIEAASGPEIADAEKAADLPGSFDEKEIADAKAYAGGESIGGPAPAPVLPTRLPPKMSASRKQGIEAKIPAKLSQASLAAEIASQEPIPTPAPVPQTPISVSPAKTGEHFLYSKILETYRSHNEEEMQKTLQLLLKTYPESVFADNALYLSGLLSFEQGNLKLAQKQFERLLKEYPRSNKAVSSLFAKAAIEKRTGRLSSAKKSFVRVRDLYPGSPEAARVSVELKLLESATTKRRE